MGEICHKRCDSKHIYLATAVMQSWKTWTCFDYLGTPRIPNYVWHMVGIQLKMCWLNSNKGCSIKCTKSKKKKKRISKMSSLTKGWNMRKGIDYNIWKLGWERVVLGLIWSLLTDNAESLVLFKILTLQQLHHGIKRETERGWERLEGRTRDMKISQKIIIVTYLIKWN